MHRRGEHDDPHDRRLGHADGDLQQRANGLRVDELHEHDLHLHGHQRRGRQPQLFGRRVERLRRRPVGQRDRGAGPRREPRPRPHRRRPGGGETTPPAPPPPTTPVVEYFHSGFGHYFITSFDADIAALDSGRFQGWSRTGRSFKAYVSNGGSQRTVCRFFTEAFAPKSSHFYTSSSAECNLLRNESRDWKYEADAFYVESADNPAGRARPAPRPSTACTTTARPARRTTATRPTPACAPT